MKTFETRLVPISEEHKVNNVCYLCWRHDWDFPATCYFDENIIDKMYDGWVSGDGDEALFVNPTHFLQFKINGEWTHEFKVSA